MASVSAATTAPSNVDHATITDSAPPLVENSSSPPKGKMRVSDFVTASFARFEKEYGPSVVMEVGGDGKRNNDVTHAVGSPSRKSDKVKTNSNNRTYNTSNSNKSNNQKTAIDEKEDSDRDSESSSIYEDEPFLILLFTLYLPLFLLGIRRTTFGTAHILSHFARSLVLGHVLRLLISIALFSMPLSWSERLGSHLERIWASFTRRIHRLWIRITRIYWVKHVMWALTGDGRYFPHSGEGRLHHLNHLQQYYSHDVAGGNGVGEAPRVYGNTVGSSYSLGAPSNLNNAGGSWRKGFNPDHVWPPPALTLLTLMTVVAFVVHPDGLTWIVLGKCVDGFMYTFQLCTHGLSMLKDGTIPTLAASSVFVALILLGVIIHKTLSPKCPKHKQGGSDSAYGGDGAASSSSKKNKKGKKGRNGRHGHNTHASRGRGKVRGGHFRSTKNLYDSPERERSRSRSRSRSPVRKTDSNIEENDDSERNETVPSLVVHETRDTIDGGLHQNRTRSLQSQENLISNPRPYSIDSTSVPQLSDDVSSCSSIAGSLSETHGTKSNRIVAENVTNENSVNRRKKGRELKGRKGQAITGSSNDIVGSTSNPNITASSTASKQLLKHDTHVPPGFVSKDPTMTPTRVSPLPLSSATTTPVRATAPSPMQKPIGTPATASRSVGTRVSISRDDTNFHSFGHDAHGPRPSHPALRNRTSSDGFVKHKPSNIGPIGTSTYNSQPLSKPPGIVRYGLTNYAAYAQNDNRYAPGKIELAAFLAQVGLVGSACADLLADLFDVDALAALTPDQLFSYKIGREKQLEIKALLEARRLRLQQQQRNAPTVLRPPPGLGFKPDGLKGVLPSSGSGMGISSSSLTNPTQSPIQPPSRFNSENATGFLLPPTSTNQNGSNITLPSLTNTESSFVSGSDPIIKPLDPSITLLRPYAINPNPFPRFQVSEPETDDDKIDADLQQLGDRMVGSILDF